MKLYPLFFLSQFALAQCIGQGPTMELATLRAIRLSLIPYGVTVESSFSEETTEKSSHFKETYVIRVNVNSLPGINILKAEKSGGVWTVSVRFNEAEAMETLEKQIQENESNLPGIPMKYQKTRIILEEELKQEQEMLQLLKRHRALNSL